VSPFDGLRGERQPPRPRFRANNGVFGLIVGMVTAEDFADPVHGQVFTAARRLNERGETANCLTLRAQFDQDRCSPMSRLGWMERYRNLAERIGVIGRLPIRRSYRSSASSLRCCESRSR
jgi:DnaB helicase-like protein